MPLQSCDKQETEFIKDVSDSISVTKPDTTSTKPDSIPSNTPDTVHNSKTDSVTDNNGNVSNGMGVNINNWNNSCEDFGGTAQWIIS